MAITSRAGLLQYVRQKLGEPVVQVNVAPEQLEQCVDDALAIYADYHYDGSEHVYLPYTLTPSTLTASAGITGTFANGETITGSVSDAVGTVYTQANSTVVQVVWTGGDLSGPFVATDVVTGATSGATATVTAVSAGDIDNRYVTVDDSIISVNGIFRPGMSNMSTNSNALFSVNYQLIASDIWGINGGGSMGSVSMINYYMTKRHLELVEQLLTGAVRVRFQRHTRKLHLDWDWDLNGIAGRYIIIDCYGIIDPDDFTAVWNDWWLRRYVTALAKQQWGQNLSKLSGIALPGNVTLNGDKIYAEGTRELEKLDDELQKKFSLPIDFFTG